jgi:hypothetical protein
MKYVLFVMMLSLFTAKSVAQTNNRIFYSQLMVVFSDLDKNFEFLKADLRDSSGTDAVYGTNMRLEGTKENFIVFSSNTATYQAMIDDSTSEEGSKLIMEAWKNKLNEVLAGTSFTELAKDYQSPLLPDTNGYRYLSDRISVLLLKHKSESGSYWINLVVKNR